MGEQRKKDPNMKKKFEFCQVPHCFFFFNRQKTENCNLLVRKKASSTFVPSNTPNMNTTKHETVNCLVQAVILTAKVMVM